VLIKAFKKKEQDIIMNMINTLKTLSISAAIAATSLAVNAQTLDISIQNLSHGTYFTPLVVTAHDMDTRIFEVGTMASTSLTAQAEGGSIAGVVADLAMTNAATVENPANGLLAPGAKTMFMLDTMDNMYLSLSSMILPTNDGFVGLDSWMIPTMPGTYTIDLLAYDAGTELNNELIVDGAGAPGVAGIPADPSMMAGTMGTGVMATSENMYVHIHPGTIGDDDKMGGMSDLDNRYHRWLNPIARLTVTVPDMSDMMSESN
jgi:hypothetical protein